MIDKERLLELIEQGATIYTVHQDLSVHEFDLSIVKDKKIEIYEDWFVYFTPNVEHDFDMEYLCETMEDVEKLKWHKEFGSIERVERLVLPTWEEFKYSQKETIFNNKQNTYILRKDVASEMMVACAIGGDIAIRIINTTQKTEIFRKALTKENYTEACRKCKELFLGGEDE